MSKGVIWSSEYSLGPQIWGPGGAPGPRGPPGSATGGAAPFVLLKYYLELFCISVLDHDNDNHDLIYENTLRYLRYVFLLFNSSLLLLKIIVRVLHYLTNQIIITIDIMRLIKSRNILTEQNACLSCIVLVIANKSKSFLFFGNFHDIF